MVIIVIMMVIIVIMMVMVVVLMMVLVMVIWFGEKLVFYRTKCVMLLVLYFLCDVQRFQKNQRSHAYI